LWSVALDVSFAFIDLPVRVCRSKTTRNTGTGVSVQESAFYKQRIDELESAVRAGSFGDALKLPTHPCAADLQVLTLQGDNAHLQNAYANLLGWKEVWVSLSDYWYSVAVPILLIWFLQGVLPALAEAEARSDQQRTEYQRMLESKDETLASLQKKVDELKVDLAKCLSLG
jgi:hypothetical protein